MLAIIAEYVNEKTQSVAQLSYKHRRQKYRPGYTFAQCSTEHIAFGHRRISYKKLI